MAPEGPLQERQGKEGTWEESSPGSDLPQLQGPAHRESPSFKVHSVQLTVSPSQDEGILLQRKAGQSRKSVSNQDRERMKDQTVTKESDLGDKQQGIDLRHFQAGPEGERAGSASERQCPRPPPCLPPKWPWLTCMGADDATVPYSPL